MKLYKSLHQVEVVRRPLIWDIAPEMSNFAIFGFYLENYDIGVQCKLRNCFILSLRKKGGRCAKDVRFEQDDRNSSPGKPYPISL
jgi:hypothetical protein